jgi:hypothetical protein
LSSPGRTCGLGWKLNGWLEEKELYILAQVWQRLSKERAIRRRRLKKLWQRLAGAATDALKSRPASDQAWPSQRRSRTLGLEIVQISVAQAENSPSQLFSYRLDKDRLRVVRCREGRYLLRSNLIGIEPAQLWELYIRLTQIEAHFRRLYRLLLACDFAPPTPQTGSGPDSARCIREIKTIQIIDVHLPTTDMGARLILPRYTQPDQEHRMLLHGLNLELPHSAQCRLFRSGP